MDNNQNQQPNGYGMPQPNMQAGMPGQTPQPGYGMPGQNVQPGYGMPQQPAGGNQPPKKKKTGLIVGLIILAVVLIGGVIFAFMKFGKKDGKGSSKDAEAAKQTVVDFCEGMKNRGLPEGIGVAAAILMRMAKDGGKERLLAMKDNFFVQLTGALDEEGNVDIDRLYKYARDEIDGKKIKLFSIKDKDMRFDVTDVDKLYKYIQEV